MQHNTKQVQVDLQDLGYETCGRSENEAERDDTSSPGLLFVSLAELVFLSRSLSCLNWNVYLGAAHDIPACYTGRKCEIDKCKMFNNWDNTIGHFNTQVHAH